MDDLARRALLFDFYGELLTEHQRSVYEEVVMDDYSLAEVAENYGISRQGVHDLVRRSQKALEEYESRLHLVSRFIAVRDDVTKIYQMTQHYEEKDVGEAMREIADRSRRILEEL